ncbi:7246_t:CDS:2 [Cetraspora pellucida]|uniref:7246_t:CDS:1 n=1 Tax=Cetraspora pellucida TaxID=1433469 RepID=A0ACA9K605_9GLOM|nr:7246_t:CDS:2 [Cetraspora pellucida]
MKILKEIESEINDKGRKQHLKLLQNVSQERTVIIKRYGVLVRKI